MGKLIKSYPVLSLCLFIGIILLPNLNVIQVSIMEARNFITAREMISDGHWLLTTMNGEARYEKPPLPTWLTALSGILFGFQSVFGMRLPAVIMIMLLCTFVYKFSLKLELNQEHSLRNGFICATSFYVIGIILEAPWDIYTHAFMMVAIYYLFQVFNKLIIRPKHIWLAGIFMGFSFLSKGPISMYALFLPFLIAYGFSYKYNYFKSKWLSVLAIIFIALIVGGSWYVAVRWLDPDTFHAIAEKETGNWASYNVRPFYYYWSFFTQSGIWTIPAFVSLLYPYMKSRVSNVKAYKLSFFWTVFSVLLLSLIPEKKSRYLMPVLIPLALNIGFYVEYLISHFKSLKKGEKIPVLFNFGLIAFIGILFPFMGYFMLKDHLDGYWANFIVASSVLFGIGAMLFYQLLKGEMKQVFLYTVLFFGSVLLTATPLKQMFLSDNYNPISSLKTEQSLNIYSFSSISPEMLWQYGTKIQAIKSDDGVVDYPSDATFGLLANNLSPEEEASLKTLYTMEEKAIYDLNEVSISSRKYNDRLVAKYYILTKK